MARYRFEKILGYEHFFRGQKVIALAKRSVRILLRKAVKCYVQSGTSLCVLTVCVGCSVAVHDGYITEDKHDARVESAKFHAQFNSGKFSQIYDISHPTFQNALTRAEWVRRVVLIRERFGKFRQVVSSRQNVVMAAAVQVRLVYASDFERGRATELFTYIRDGEQLRLGFYQILPGDPGSGDRK